jgi:hypothetical protein
MKMAVSLPILPDDGVHVKTLLAKSLVVGFFKAENMYDCVTESISETDNVKVHVCPTIIDVSPGTTIKGL